MTLGLVFQFVQPVLEDPYEPRICELEECLTCTTRDHVAGRTIRRSVAHEEEESAGNSATPVAGEYHNRHDNRSRK